MAIIKCENGHFFDDSKYAKCPYCVTMEHERNRFEDQLRDSVTIAMSKYEEPEEPMSSVQEPIPSDDQKTVGVFGRQRGMDYVTGWLVCVGGGEKGRDYRLHNGNNWIGRSYGMDVCVVDDAMMSRDNHASIVFEPRNRRFYLVPGNGTVTQINGEQVIKAAELCHRDRILLGSSEFVFVPFCGEDYIWDQKEE